MSYTQLTQEERYQIYALMKAGHDQATIAGIIDRNPGTISRELRRNRGLKEYRPQQAIIWPWCAVRTRASSVLARRQRKINSNRSIRNQEASDITK